MINNNTSRKQSHDDPLHLSLSQKLIMWHVKYIIMTSQTFKLRTYNIKVSMKKYKLLTKTKEPIARL